MSLLTEAISHFILPSDVVHVVFSPTTGGVNNVVYYVHLHKVWIGVLRVYNNGNDDEKVAYEHAVLTQLHKETLSFSIPVTMPLISSSNHGATVVTTDTMLCPQQQTYVKLNSTGTHAALFQPIKGRLPGKA